MIERGYTIVELMVTMLLVSILAVALGGGFVKLLTITENEREEAYVGETLADICADYAKMISMGTSFGTNKDFKVRVKYRQETGGVSLETGRVTRAAYFTSSTNTEIRALDLNVETFDLESVAGYKLGFSRVVSGNPTLIRMKNGEMLSCTCTITPLGISSDTSKNTPKSTHHSDPKFIDFQTTDAALGYLEVKAWYKYTDDDGRTVTTNATVGRIVRLWNKD